MRFPNYNHRELEPEILKYWGEHKTLESLRDKNKKGKKFYFLQGPPYTSGRIHLGHAWNMALKDMVLRWRRMQGYKVWDRAGYDMHGLPTEQKVMAKLNLKNKEEIEQFGLKKFISECGVFCVEMMNAMNRDFKQLGITMDFSQPYQPITKEFMEAEWWLIKQAHKKKRLYQGLRTMHWDAATQTAVAKHELEYKNVTDTSIYMKFPLKERKNTFFIIWTTTPWTIPLNLAIMANPGLTYVEVQVGSEIWIMARERMEHVLEKAGVGSGTPLKTLTEYPGKALEKVAYNHPLDVKRHLPAELQGNPRLFTILLSSEYVDAASGTGLVHCAPGCGPEDYEVGHLHHLPPFNCVNEAGFFEIFGPFTGLRAKLDDKQFIQLIEESGSLLAKEAYTHEYPHGERSHQPVIFRTTKQWFFKVEDLREKILKANEKIYWNPEAAKNAFRSWIENLRDNSITKQRYWGTPVPIWQADDGDYIVVGSVAELEKLSKQKISNMHIPDIDQIVIRKKGRGGKEKLYKRIPDVLDVWIDAGTVSWNCLDYPMDKHRFKEFFPPDFILEGKDQIRGWFNLLMVASFLALDKPSFKNVFMHGFLNDVGGVKMSKSLGNIIAPDELLQKHGADVLRYYMSQTTVGEDINFSWEECALKQRNVLILWNIHKFLISLARENDLNPFALNLTGMQKSFAVEEKYILSKLHHTIAQVTALLEKYKLDEIIAPLEELFLALSRTYIQMIREKSALGNGEEKKVCLYTIAHVLLEQLKMFQIVAPFVCEAIYLNLCDEFGEGSLKSSLKEPSISHCAWPTAEKKLMNSQLERDMELLQQIMQTSLAAREKAKLGVRWPVQEIIVVTENKEIVKAVRNLQDIFMMQLNCKNVTVQKEISGIRVKVKPDYGKIGLAYAELSPQVIAKLALDSAETIMSHINKEGAYVFRVEGREVRITREMLQMEHIVPEPYHQVEFKQGFVYLNGQRSELLEGEGYAREVMRQIQGLRKSTGLEKKDRIKVHLKVSVQMKGMLEKFAVEMQEKVGAVELQLSAAEPARAYAQQSEFKIKQEQMKVWFEKV